MIVCNMVLNLFSSITIFPIPFSQKGWEAKFTRNVWFSECETPWFWYYSAQKRDTWCYNMATSVNRIDAHANTFLCTFKWKETKGVNKSLKRQIHSDNGQEIKCHEIENLIWEFYMLNIMSVFINSSVHALMSYPL